MGGYLEWHQPAGVSHARVMVFMPQLAVLADRPRARFLVGDGAPRSVMDALLCGVAEAAGLTVADLLGRSRRLPCVDARIAAYAAARRIGRILAQRGAPQARAFSVLRIAAHMGGRDHTTVVSGVQRYAARVAAGDQALQSLMQAGLTAGLAYCRHAYRPGRGGLPS